MSAPDDDTRQETSTRQETALYVYGIVPGDVEVEPDAVGVGDPPGRVTTLRHKDIAALVSEIPVDRPLGRSEDLEAHARLLDGSVTVAPVLPLRFGAVVTDADAVTDELLAPHLDEFRTALDDIEGKAQYVVKGRYDESAIIREILAENSEAARLREEMRNVSEDAGRNIRIELGQIVEAAVAAKRDADTHTAVEALERLTRDVRVRPPTHDLDAVHIALLLEVAAQEDLEATLSQLANDWTDRVHLQILGPMAAYDFVTAQSNASTAGG